ncbi:hypothetical protein [Mesorhizobium carmichaelinearum]|uniref:hypothetical protein n=1 Tax=Mesorhizobium carmichaelinearum TaxID=1208188 RepID=UPI0011813CC2|nr:hypothetical protein [Mesorhizobium carmichaelinearum]
MSVDSTLHPKQASKKQLTDFLRALGYTPTKHLWIWPKGSVHFHWFNATDYLSFDGVEATVYPCTDDAHNLGPCEWALYTRTRSSGSRADKVFQNETIRRARALFGGNFYNDWGGRNRYSAERAEHRDAASRGLYQAYEVVSQHLSATIYALPPEHETMARISEDASLATLARADPTRILYNALVPFAIASLEGFFSKAFYILIRYSDRAQAHLRTQERKIEFQDAVALAKGTKTVEEIVTSWYSFQNVSSIQKAYSEWLGIDFRKILRSVKNRKGKTKDLDETLANMIAFRHRVIHELELDFDLRHTDISNTMKDAERIIEAFVVHLEKNHGKIIRDETAIALEG